MLQLIHDANNTQRFVSTKTNQQSSQEAATKNAQHPVSSKGTQQSSILYINTAGGVPYAVSTKASTKERNTNRKNQGVCTNNYTVKPHLAANR